MNTAPANEKYGSDELIILGSGGARHVATTQIRSCGGFILRAMQGKIQCHIDPGPSAIRDIRDRKINPRATNYVFVTHFHIDHVSDLPLVVEALQNDAAYREKKGTLILPKPQLDNGVFDRYFFRLLDRIIGMDEEKIFELEPGFRVIGTHTMHDALPNFGYILELDSDTMKNYHYRIAFTSDTAVFPEYPKIYKNVDILVANILRPDRVLCRGHITTDEFIPLLQEISPAICVLTHLGIQFHERVTEQVRKIQQAVGDKIVVIGSEDGLHIPFAATLNNHA